MTQDRRPARRSAQTRLSAFYVAVFLVLGLHLPYWPVWLEARGLSAEEVGILVATGLAMRVMTGPVIGALVDRMGRRRRPIIILAGLGLLSFCLFLGAEGFWGLLAVTVLSATFYPALMPLTETLAVARARQDGFDYGRTRLWGSLSFITASLLGGVLLDRVGPTSILPAVLVCLALTLAVGFGLPDDPLTDGHRPRSARASFALVARRPLFWLFAFSAGLNQASHAVYYSFGSIHWRSLGLDGELIGMLWAVGVVTEIAFFTVSGRLMRRLGPLMLLGIGAGAGVIRWSVLALDPPVAVLVASQMLHALTFAAAHLSAIHLIDRAVPRSAAVTAQSLYSAVSGGILLGVLTLASGPLYAALAGGAYAAMAVAALFGLLGIGLLARLWPGVSLVRDPD